MCEAVCNKKPMKTRYPHSRPLEKAIQSQGQLPPDFILKGYLSDEWFHALLQHDRGSAKRTIVHLLLSLWKILFMQIWDFRNGELHGRDSVVETYERSILRGELIEWNRNAAEKIGAHQAYLAEYNITDIDK